MNETMEKVFRVAVIRKFEQQVTKGDISYSRMVELMNEMAHTHYVVDKNCNLQNVVRSALIIKTMSTNFTKHNNKAKRYRQQIDEIQAKYPEINMKSRELKNDIIKLHDLFIKVIHEEVDAKECKSDNPNDMCSDCKCWKHTRMMCS